jgi:hypothetical protein
LNDVLARFDSSQLRLSQIETRSVKCGPSTTHPAPAIAPGFFFCANASIHVVAALVSLPDTGPSPQAETGRHLPDSGSPGFLTLNGRFGANNRSLIGQKRKLGTRNWTPNSGHSPQSLPRGRKGKVANEHGGQLMKLGAALALRVASTSLADLRTSIYPSYLQSSMSKFVLAGTTVIFSPCGPTPVC